ncbi:hypothetical protein FD977_10065 [Polynucleobacter sp. AP-Elch-400A-B2]|uniref:TorF family putative porin n=1 Tax=Polynucleobacter sp. AP-Elch-400A-B2 TaxID=2576930 RepID=UPI001BFE3C1B|nr:TorF family putative porin [Polynucleobacter sp. AP-Elch-400A-B2]QWE24577.1 hypothetical protein FD977_10065 [Polynucleobacter sp. AP-Elch-400A-B2]
MKTIQKSAIALAASGLFATTAFAQTAPAAPEAPEASPITANVTVVNDYRYRGLTQSNFKPAIQGGFDYAHESGFYVGNWNSSISWIGDGYGVAGSPTRTATVSAPLEMDFYAGFKKEFIAEGFATDVGVLQYYYPTQGLPGINGVSRTASATANTTALGAARQSAGVSPNTTEIYAAQNFTFGPVTGFAKLSYAVTPLFGIYNSTGSTYPDLTVNYDTGVYGIALNAHAGYQMISNNSSAYNFSYADWKLGLTKDFGGGLSGAIAYVGTNAKTYAGNPVYATPQNSNAGKAGGLISLTKAF